MANSRLKPSRFEPFLVAPSPPSTPTRSTGEDRQRPFASPRSRPTSAMEGANRQRDRYRFATYARQLKARNEVATSQQRSLTNSMRSHRLNRLEHQRVLAADYAQLEELQRRHAVEKPGTTPVSSRSRPNNWRDMKEVQPRALVISSDVRGHVESARARLSDHERNEQQRYTTFVRERCKLDERELQRRRRAQQSLRAQARLLTRRSTALDQHKDLRHSLELKFQHAEVREHHRAAASAAALKAKILEHRARMQDARVQAWSVQSSGATPRWNEPLVSSPAFRRSHGLTRPQAIGGESLATRPSATSA